LYSPFRLLLSFCHWVCFLHLKTDPPSNYSFITSPDKTS
jgi:hypothetical protein